jgi:hypothetical protein
MDTKDNNFGEEGRKKRKWILLPWFFGVVHEARQSQDKSVTKQDRDSPKTSQSQNKIRSNKTR